MLIPQKYFIYISIFIILIYLVMIYIAYRKGFLYELASLLYTVLAVLLAWFASPVLAGLFPLFDAGTINSQYQILDSLFNLNTLLNTLAYFIIIFLILKLLYVFISLLLKSLNEIPVIGHFNQVLGGAFGFINATIIVLSLSILLSLPLFKNGNEVREKTILRYIIKYSDMVSDEIIKRISTKEVKDGLTNIDIDAYREDFRAWLESIVQNEE